ncbi:unknown protein [Seminavis robusta]|uniref:Uncharacterized protein n=1 Tax=Seminavis robusta TaxID=568900 RepID=A0A9N8DMV5_9STRA|nr:unknown protein [Seminavis robusta]|eukprot:Sro214_g088860.1 n/a (147) ;mRNA; r:81101-81541
MDDQDEVDDRDDVEEGPSKDEWNAVRKQLKDDVLSGVIPHVLKEMRPAAVYQMYADAANPIIACVDYTNKRQNAKFTLMLRTLRNKHADGDLVNEDKAEPIVWRKSAAKQFLKRAFREGLIPDNISTNEDMEEIWNDLCCVCEIGV